MRSIRGASLASLRSLRSVMIVMAGLLMLEADAAYLKANDIPPSQKSSLHDINIPPGTILPVRLGSLSSEKMRKGEIIRARIMQDVPLENGAKLRAGSSVLGRVIDVHPAASGQKAALAIRFDTVLQGNERIPVVTNLRAFASTLEVEFAQVPTIGPGESDVFDWLPTTQVGGEVVYGKGGVVTNGDRVVGHSVNNGVLAQVDPKEGTRCYGSVENDRLQAFWVFSSDACGTYGFPWLVISHTGQTDPQGEIVLVSERGPVKIRSGSGMLLRVELPAHYYVEDVCSGVAAVWNHSAALAANVSITAMFCTNSGGMPCRSCRYVGLLYETQTLPCPSSQTKIFKGRSSATLGAACINGVPAFGLPKISSLVGRIFIPTFSASPL